MNYQALEVREIFHLLFLEQLLKVSTPDLYVLKGGVNLRFFFKSPRYSEDMDLDVAAGSVETLKKNGYKILKEASLLRVLKTYSIEEIIINDPAKAKHTETTQRFKLRLVNSAGVEFPTKVEFSRRSKPQGMKVEVIDSEILHRYHRPVLQLQHYAGEEAFWQKIQALAGRAETQARDLFDAYLLYLSGHAEQIKKYKSKNAQVFSLAEANIASISYQDYAGQVLEFLSEEFKAQYDKATFQRMKNTFLELVRNGE